MDGWTDSRVATDSVVAVCQDSSIGCFIATTDSRSHERFAAGWLLVYIYIIHGAWMTFSSASQPNDLACGANVYFLVLLLVLAAWWL